jgi:hypothetical protein
MKTTTIFMFVLITALGAAAVTTAISFVDQIDAKSCNQTHDKAMNPAIVNVSMSQMSE